MKFLEDFSDEEKEWFWGEFIHGQRHISDPLFDWYFSVSVVSDTWTENGLAQLNMQTYGVSADGEVFSSVNFDQESFMSASASVKFDEEIKEVKLSFLEEPLTEQLKDVFGNDAIGISVLGKGGVVDAVVIYLDDLGDSDISPHHLQTTMMMTLVPLLKFRLIRSGG